MSCQVLTQAWVWIIPIVALRVASLGWVSLQFPTRISIYKCNAVDWIALRAPPRQRACELTFWALCNWSDICRSYATVLWLSLPAAQPYHCMVVETAWPGWGTSQWAAALQVWFGSFKPSAHSHACCVPATANSFSGTRLGGEAVALSVMRASWQPKGLAKGVTQRLETAEREVVLWFIVKVLPLLKRGPISRQQATGISGAGLGVSQERVISDL